MIVASLMDHAVLYTNNSLWRHLMMKKGLQLEYVRRYLQLEDFNFIVRNRNDVHMLTNLERT